VVRRNESPALFLRNGDGARRQTLSQSVGNSRNPVARDRAQGQREQGEKGQQYQWSPSPASPSRLGDFRWSVHDDLSSLCAEPWKRCRRAEAAADRFNMPRHSGLSEKFLFPFSKYLTLLVCNSDAREKAQSI
jgi:hypothetical protein